MHLGAVCHYGHFNLSPLPSLSMKRLPFPARSVFDQSLYSKAEQTCIGRIRLFNELAQTASHAAAGHHHLITLPIDVRMHACNLHVCVKTHTPNACVCIHIYMYGGSWGGREHVCVYIYMYMQIHSCLNTLTNLSALTPACRQMNVCMHAHNCARM